MAGCCSTRIHIHKTPTRKESSDWKFLSLSLLVCASVSHYHVCGFLVRAQWCVHALMINKTRSSLSLLFFFLFRPSASASDSSLFFFFFAQNQPLVSFVGICARLIICTPEYSTRNTCTWNFELTPSLILCFRRLFFFFFLAVMTFNKHKREKARDWWIRRVRAQTAFS